MPGPASRTESLARRWLLNLHLYGGLVTFWYLMVYGIPPLGFNHPLPDP